MANIYRPFPGDITRVHGIRVGQAQNAQAMTGVTVVLPQAEGAVGGVSVRGAAPGTRETDLLRPGNLVERAHAVVLSGGSAYGLAAADGVMRYLEQMGVGALRKAAVEGDEKTGDFLAGQISGMINKEQPAAEIIQEMFQEAEEVLKGAGKWVR